jgi:chromosome segregation ATPase
MNAMTPEEQRWTKIENALSSLAEHVGRHDEEMAEIRASQKVITLAVAKLAEEQRSGHRELRELRELQRNTEEKLNALITTVDRIIRDRGSLN